MEVVRHHASNQDWIVYKCIFIAIIAFFNSLISQLKMILEKIESNPIVRCVSLMFVNKY